MNKYFLLILILLFFRTNTFPYNLTSYLFKNNHINDSDNFKETNKNNNSITLYSKNDIDILGRDIEFPESLNVYTKTIETGIFIPTNSGDYHFTIGKEINYNKVEIYLERDSINFIGHSNFTNKKEYIVCNYYNSFLKNRFILNTSAKPIFLNRTDKLSNSFKDIKLNTAISLKYSIPSQFSITLSNKRFYSDNIFKSTLLGFTLSSDFVNNIIIGNMVETNFRNRLCTDIINTNITYNLTKNSEIGYEYSQKSTSTNKLYLLSDVAIINFKFHNNSFYYTYLFNNSLTLYSNLFFNNGTGNIDAKYKRGNGYYSYLIKGLNITNTDNGLNLKANFHTTKKHILETTTGFNKQSISTNNKELELDPVKFISISYGTTHLKGYINSTAFYAGETYKFKNGNYNLLSEIIFFNNNFNGLVYNRNTWTLEKDTTNIPIKNIKSVEIKIGGEIKFLKKYAIIFNLKQTLPLNITLTEKVSKALEISDINKNKEKRTRIGLLNINLNLYYHFK